MTTGTGPAIQHYQAAVQLLQQQPQGYPAVDQALEAIAGSLNLIHQLATAPAAPVMAPQKLVFDGIEIDLERRQVLRQGEPVELTGTEFELLAMLARSPQKVFHRDEILNRLRGQDADLYTRAVDILVSRLRKKLEPLDCIKTLRNAGYAFAGGHA